MPYNERRRASLTPLECSASVGSSRPLFHETPITGEKQLPRHDNPSQSRSQEDADFSAATTGLPAFRDHCQSKRVLKSELPRHACTQTSLRTWLASRSRRSTTAAGRRRRRHIRSRRPRGRRRVRCATRRGPPLVILRGAGVHRCCRRAPARLPPRGPLPGRRRRTVREPTLNAAARQSSASGGGAAAHDRPFAFRFRAATGTISYRTAAAAATCTASRRLPAISLAPQARHRLVTGCRPCVVVVSRGLGVIATLDFPGHFGCDRSRGRRSACALSRSGGRQGGRVGRVLRPRPLGASTRARRRVDKAHRHRITGRDGQRHVARHERL